RKAGAAAAAEARRAGHGRSLAGTAHRVRVDGAERALALRVGAARRAGRARPRGRLALRRKIGGEELPARELRIFREARLELVWRVARVRRGEVELAFRLRSRLARAEVAVE